MSRVAAPFKKKSGVLSIYCTAGFPKIDSTIEVIQALQENGADMIELGIPYSDPLADGPIIQLSSSVALSNGMSIKKLFEQLKGFRQSIHIPVILMGYMNPVLQYGFEKFCVEAAAMGIDGLILPDLPAHEFETSYIDTIKKHKLDFIFLVTPETAEERIRLLDKLSSGFLYAVSSSSTTGSAKDFGRVLTYLDRLEKLKLKNPVLAGFGIRNREDFKQVCNFANGAIIGSAYIQALSQENSVNKATKSFLSSILQD